jgi:hypothetical protein
MQLDSNFEADLRGAVLDAVEDQLVETGRAEQIVRAATRDALESAGYDAEGILAALEGPAVRHEDDRITATWTIDHPGALPLEVGSSDHVVSSDDGPLAFEWPDAPAEVKDQFEHTDGDLVFFQEVEVAGVDETRHTRRALAELRRALQGR